MLERFLRPLSKIATATVVCFGLSMSASAEVVQNVFLPLNQAVNNACTGELVLLSGELHLLITNQPTGNGLRIGTHSQPAGATGTGTVSGATYHATGVTVQDFFVDGPPPWDRTFVNNFYIIGEGDAPNFRVHATIHITINANGETTADVMEVRTSCN